MPFCAAIHCSNRLRKGCGKSFHRFPRGNPALMKEWLVKMRRDYWTPHSYSTICSDHFEERCFDRTGQTTRLYKDAVPTVFNFPVHLLKTVSHRKHPFPRDLSSNGKKPFQAPSSEVTQPKNQELGSQHQTTSKSESSNHNSSQRDGKKPPQAPSSDVTHTKKQEQGIHQTTSESGSSNHNSSQRDGNKPPQAPSSDVTHTKKQEQGIHQTTSESGSSNHNSSHQKCLPHMVSTRMDMEEMEDTNHLPDDSTLLPGDKCTNKHPNTQKCKTSHQATPRRQTALEDITHSKINVPITPAKKSATIHDHTYSINESPRSVKRKLDRMFDHTTTLKKRLKSSQSKSRRLRKKVDTLENIVKTLQYNNLLTESGLEMVKKTCEVPIEIMKRMVKSRNANKTSRETCHPALRAFALTLHFYSPEAYRYVRKTFDLWLPHPTTIRNWYSATDGKPGFTEEAFKTLEMKAKEAKESGHELVCSLMLDEMTIKKDVQWDGNKIHGYVDIGTECSDDSNPVASHTLVFMVIPLNSNWKIPVGYFLISGMSGVERANLIQHCLSKLADIGVWIRSLTCDGPSCHFTMLDTLGATMRMPDLIPSFPHPLDHNHQVSVFLDICHMLRLMKNTLASNGILKDGKGGFIKWEYIKEIHKLQEEERLLLGNKLCNAPIEWQKQKMKMNLSAQTLSQSVADALEFLRDQGLPQFRGSDATIDFIRTIDHLFDVLNSRSLFARNLKAPLRPVNECVWRPFLTEAFDYLSSLTNAQGRKMCMTSHKTPFIGFLASIKSVENMYDKLVAGDLPKLKYLLTYKMSQDHLELFFRTMRSCFGCNNNPTACEFSTAYKKLLIRHEIPGVGGNCSSQDKTIILHASSSNVDTDTYTSDDMLLIRKYDLSTQSPAISDHEYADIPHVYQLSSYKKAGISFLARYVVHIARKCLSCEECVAALATGEVVEGSFLAKKNRGGLVRPAPDVVKVCETTEQCLQISLKTTGSELSQSVGVIHAMCTAVLGEVGHLNIFSSLSDHMLDCPPDQNHVFMLIKCLAASYLKIRMHHLARELNEKVCGPVVCKQMMQLVLLKHQ